MSPLRLLSQDIIGDFLNLLPISSTKNRPLLGSFASQSDLLPSEQHIGDISLIDIRSAPGDELRLMQITLAS